MKIVNKISGAEQARNQAYTHRVNLQQGWFDKPVTFIEVMALIMTEIIEVSDAYDRDGLIGCEAGPQMRSEFADCYIRLVDCATRFKLDLGLIVDLYQHSYSQRRAGSFNGMCMQLIRRTRDAIEAWRIEGLGSDGEAGPGTARQLAYLFLHLQAACDEFGVDLMSEFNLKMAVNEARPYRHGNKHA